MTGEFKRMDEWEMSWPWLAPEDEDLEANTPWQDQPIHWLCYRGSSAEPWHVWGPVEDPGQPEVGDAFLCLLKEHLLSVSIQIVVVEKPLTWFIDLESE